MRFLRRLILRLLLFAALAGAAAVAWLPGPHRIVAPAAFGLTRIAPGVYTDRPDRADQLIGLARGAETRAADVLGSATRPLRRVLCATEACRRTFRITGRAVTFANLAVLAAPSGLNARTLFHEQIHVELHARMGPIDALTPRFPSWFNEGLATHLSGTPDVPRPRDPGWMAEVRTPLDWRRMRRTRKPAEYYGAAARLVADIEDQAGRDGLIALVERVAEGANFDAAHARLVGR